ncbi:MAG: GNAT family N-acetyltransferase [Acidocella sp.]|uniref:GNAT family N-acetyltransferase n=1 Tax=Acidocella sp. TaxID=50710 RepID=UPI003FD8A81B
MLTPLSPASPSLELLRALNNDHAQELSFADAPRFAHLIAQAFFAAHIGTEAFLIAFDQDADYDSQNFLWFRQRFSKFVYVDRVVTAQAVRGRGHAAALYNALFAAARAAGHERVTCEINADPPNPGSEAFHSKFGFQEIGSALLPNGKTVRYYERRL